MRMNILKTDDNYSLVLSDLPEEEFRTTFTEDGSEFISSHEPKLPGDNPHSDLIKSIAKSAGEAGSAGRAFQAALQQTILIGIGIGRSEKHIYPTLVNLDLGFKGLLKAADQDISGTGGELSPRMLPIEGTGIRKVDLELYEFDRTINDLEGIAEIEEKGYQLEGFPELLAFAAANPKAQLRRPIVAWRDHSWHSGRYHLRVPGLMGRGDNRILAFYDFPSKIPISMSYRVLVSRKRDG